MPWQIDSCKFEQENAYSELMEMQMKIFAYWFFHFQGNGADQYFLCTFHHFSIRYDQPACSILFLTLSPLAVNFEEG